MIMKEEMVEIGECNRRRKSRLMIDFSESNLDLPNSIDLRLMNLMIIMNDLDNLLFCEFFYLQNINFYINKSYFEFL